MKYLSTEELAQWLSVSPGTLRNWRLKGKGPEYIKMGEGKTSRVAYSIEAVTAFEEKWSRKPKANATGKRKAK